MKHIIVLTAFFITVLTACKKEQASTYNPSVKADLSVEFDNIAGASDFQLNTGVYKNAARETFTISRLKYYVSNFILTNTDESIYKAPQDSCYFLIDESDETTHEPVLHIPEGEYKTISFIVGVDSARSTMDIRKRTGVLDSVEDMYWNAAKGYVFFKMEGVSPAIPAAGNHFIYEIGGNLKTITLDLTQRGIPKIKSGKDTNIHLFVDILRALSSKTAISFAATPLINAAAGGKQVADNYATMFKHDHTEN